MALINFGYRVDMSTVDSPTDPSGYVVAYDLDGILKQKDYNGNVSIIGGTSSGGGSTASLNIFGATNSLLKFETPTSLTQSRYSDNGNSGSYGGNGSFVTFLAGGNSLLKIDRGQSNIDFSLGNPNISQPSIVNSSNTYGLDIISAGQLKLMLSSTMSALIAATSGYLNIPITPATGSNSDKFLMRGASGSITQIDYNSVLYTTLTTSELVTKISNSTLVPGSSYRITDTSPVHYGGTEIVLKAITNNKLDSIGVGKFYDPIYYNSGMDGCGVWTNLSRFDIDTVAGLFEENETITADNSATAIIFGMIQDGEIFIEITSGVWSTATSFTGDINGGSANILIDTYIAGASAGDKVIWGGKVWSNISGNLGTASLNTNLLLNPEWEEVINTDGSYYNEVWDVIEWDITNNFLTSRYNVNSNVRVSETYKSYEDNNFSYSPYSPSIVTMQWGNYAIYGNDYGFQDIEIVDSYINLLNFRGSSFKHNKIINSYYFNNSSEGINLKIENNTFDQQLIYDNKFINTIISFNNFSNSLISLCLFDTSDVSNLTLSNLSGLSNLTLFNASYLQNSLFSSSYFNNSRLSKFSFTENTLLNGSIVRFGILTSDYLFSKAILATIFNSVEFTINIVSASIIFGDYSKEVITRPDGAIRIKYINNSDAQIVTALTT